MQTILLVDDDPSVRAVSRLILEECGYQVLAAEDGAKALQIVKEHPGPLHLVVTDVVMPGMNGAELGRQIESLRLGIPILYLTALAVAQLADRRIVLEAGALILAKPFSVETLEKRVREVLDQSYGPSPLSTPPLAGE